MKFLKKLDAIVGKVLSFLGLASMIALFVILLANIIIRAAGTGMTLSWYSEVVEILFAWMVMLGAAMLCRNNDHFRVDLFLQKFADKRGFYWIEALCYAIAFAFYAYLLYYGYSLSVNAPQTLPVLHIAKGYCYACMPICALIMCAYTIRDKCVAVGRALGKIPVVEIHKID